MREEEQESGEKKKETSHLQFVNQWPKVLNVFYAEEKNVWRRKWRKERKKREGKKKINVEGNSRTEIEQQHKSWEKKQFSSSIFVHIFHSFISSSSSKHHKWINSPDLQLEAHLLQLVSFPFLLFFLFFLPSIYLHPFFSVIHFLASSTHFKCKTQNTLPTNSPFTCLSSHSLFPPFLSLSPFSYCFLFDHNEVRQSPATPPSQSPHHH